MPPFHLFRVGLCATLLAISATTHAAELSLSGTVLGTDGKPLSGVTVSLALAKTSTTTDASGTWSLTGAMTHVDAIRSVVPVGNGHLRLVDGRLSVRFEGRDLSGRGAGTGARSVVPGTMAARAADVPDTLLYSWNGKVRLRDTVSVSQAGIVRTLDTTFNAAIVYGYLTDSRDGQTYRTVRIGSQVWMAQNQNYTVDNSFCGGNNSARCKRYGRLYKWAAAMGLDDSCNKKSCASQVTGKRQGACPSGWHVPTDVEWGKLTDTTLEAATAATKLKSRGGWGSYGGSDEYGFGVLPAGYRDNTGLFQEFGENAYLWSASEYSSLGSYAWRRDFSRFHQDAARTAGVGKSSAGSLRCLED